MKNNVKTDSDSTLHTTPSMRQKAKILSRCFINFLKCFKLCTKSRNRTNLSNWAHTWPKGPRQMLWASDECRQHSYTANGITFFLPPTNLRRPQHYHQKCWSNHLDASSHRATSSESCWCTRYLSGCSPRARTQCVRRSTNWLACPPDTR